MTDRPAAAIVGIPPQPAARLEPNAIGVAQDTVIGMATSAPGRDGRPDAGRARGGDRLRQRPGHHR